MTQIPGRILLCFMCITSVVNSYKILIVFPGLSHSHFKLGNSLGRALAKAGHEVTVVSPYNDKHAPKGYKNVVLTGIFERRDEAMKNNVIDFEKINPFVQTALINYIMTEGTNFTLNHENVEKILESDQKFDVIIVEQFKHEGLYVLQCHYKAPLIVVNTIGSNAWINPYVGNPAPPSYIPDTFVKYSEKMNFWERAYNSLIVLFEYVLLYFMVHLKQRQIAIAKFPHCAQEEFSYNISLVFLNAHESITQPVPLVPNMINIGGFHIDPPKELPKDLKDILDNAKDGVVYFSMGSHFNSTNIKPHIKEAIIKSLGKLKQKVLWKYEDDNIKVPQNVEIRRWLPQQDILAHPNVKLFITHGGLLSIIETIHYGIPVLILPVFGDQNMNAAKAENAGYAIKISLFEVTEERLTYSLEKLLNDPKYTETAKKLSALSHDRPIKPMDLAIYWTEYIARYKGAPHLRVAAMDLPWYQYFLLDIIAFALVLAFIVATSVFILCRKCCCRRGGKKAKKD